MKKRIIATIIVIAGMIAANITYNAIAPNYIAQYSVQQLNTDNVTSYMVSQRIASNYIIKSINLVFIIILIGIWILPFLKLIEAKLKKNKQEKIENTKEETK
ncbi:MAG: hypothetical protein JXR63_10530 [Spirochaetales bacterium]|nr:hypothetical protein [Spirochaetales bacterium]